LISPEDIAARVAKAWPANRLRSAFAYILRDFVRIEMGRGRNHDSALRPTGSAKVRAIRAEAPKWLRDRVYVGTGWTLLGQCGYEELLYLESERLDNAAKSNAAAKRYRRLADELKRHKVGKVADLPNKAVLAAFAEDELRAAA